MDGNTYLEQLISEQLRLVATGESPPLSMEEIRGVARGLVAAGAVTPASANAILAGFRAALDAAGMRVTQTFVGSSDHLAAPTGTGTAGRQKSVTARNVSPSRPLKVTSLIGLTVAIPDLQYTLIALETWSTFFALRYAIVDSERDRARTTAWTTWDNRGTVHQSVGGGGHGNHGLICGEQRFEPPLAADASLLHVQIQSANSTGQIEFTL